jgi:hypothetical protein
MANAGGSSAPAVKTFSLGGQTFTAAKLHRRLRMCLRFGTVEPDRFWAVGFHLFVEPPYCSTVGPSSTSSWYGATFDSAEDSVGCLLIAR